MSAASASRSVAQQRAVAGGERAALPERGLDDEGLEVVEDVLPRRGLAAPPGGDARQPQVLAQDGPAEGLQEREEGRAFQGGPAELVRDRDAAPMGRVHEPGHAEDGAGVQLQGIAEAGVHPADDAETRFRPPTVRRKTWRSRVVRSAPSTSG
jgi:hypothetical protein